MRQLAVRPLFLALCVSIHAVIAAALIESSLARGGETSPTFKAVGELTKADAVDPVLKKGPHKAHSIELVSGIYYRIQLASRDFDAYLRLENDSGKTVAEDNDSAGQLNARII